MDGNKIIPFLVLFFAVITVTEGCEPVSILDGKTVDVSADDFKGTILAEYQNKGSRSCDRACCNLGKHSFFFSNL
jgi:hypothetical protein